MRSPPASQFLGQLRLGHRVKVPIDVKFGAKHRRCGKGPSDVNLVARLRQLPPTPLVRANVRLKFLVKRSELRM